MQTPRRKPLLTLWQWAILFAIVPLWVIQLRYTIATIQNPTKAPLWRNLDFSHYYITAERVVQGKPQVYCSAFTPDETTHRGIETGEVLEPTNPPLSTLALTPIAFGNIFQSWLIYTLLGLTALLATLWWFMGRCDGLTSRRSKTYLLLIIATSPPVLSLLHFAQVQGYLLALIVLAWALAPRHKALSGVLLGLTVALKVFTAPLLAFMLASRDYRRFSVALATATIAAFLPQLIDPRLSISEYLTCGASHVSTWALECSGSQSMPSLLRSLAYLTLLPLQMTDLATIKLVVSYLSPILWIVSGGLMGILFRNRNAPHQGWLATMAFSTICAPVAWPHYFLMTWPYLIQRWHSLSLGTRMIVWFSLPLYPAYMVDSASADWIQTITDPGASLLVWIPGTIFTIQLLVILYKDITEAKAKQYYKKSL